MKVKFLKNPLDSNHKTLMDFTFVCIFYHKLHDLNESGCELHLQQTMGKTYPQDLILIQILQ